MELSKEEEKNEEKEEAIVEQKEETIMEQKEEKIMKEIEKTTTEGEMNTLMSDIKITETKSNEEILHKLTMSHEQDNEQLNFELILENKSIIFQITRQNSIPYSSYLSEFSLDDLQNKSNFFKVFDNILDAYIDLKQRLNDKHYKVIIKEDKIIISIKTNVYKSDFDLEILQKQQDISKTVEELCFIIKKQDDQIKQILQIREPEKKNSEEIEKLKGEIKLLQDHLNSLAETEGKENKIYFKESTILEDDYEKNILIKFIEENDSTKKGTIRTKLLFKATKDGDKSVEFHNKCDLMGPTITIVKSENGRRFGGYTSISWDKSKGNYATDGINFLFSLDTSKFYKNTTGNYHTYHNESYGPTFGGGHDLCVADGCMNNTSSYSSKNDYGMTSKYELNGVQSFKVLDYEVFKI
jgi:hypothetical protein